MAELTGMVAILTRSDGVVMATAADFDPKSPGYETAGEAQSYRARQALADAYVRDYCGDDGADVMQGYDAKRLIDDLCQKKGYRVTTIAASGET